jgi:hypothetical protein
LQQVFPFRTNLTSHGPPRADAPGQAENHFKI